MFLGQCLLQIAAVLEGLENDFLWSASAALTSEWNTASSILVSVIQDPWPAECHGHWVYKMVDSLLGVSALSRTSSLKATFYEAFLLVEQTILSLKRAAWALGCCQMMLLPHSTFKQQLGLPWAASMLVWDSSFQCHPTPTVFASLPSLQDF